MKYRPEIDGLRSIAVIPVILFHAGFSAFSGGFVGVDVFFVISGYLITTIILSEMEKKTFSITNFYERRARRILPALFSVILISVFFAWTQLLPSEMKFYSESIVSVSLFSSNIFFWQNTNYFATDNDLNPMLHTWSLAVEEQYYVLFPLFLILLWHWRKRWILSSFILIAFISLSLAQWGSQHKPSAAFYLLPTRGWEIAIGAVIAFFSVYRGQAIHNILSHKILSNVLSAFGILMIGCAVFVYNDKTPFPSFYALIPTIGTGLIIVFSPHTLVGKILSTKILVAIGLISYSAYLWHQPIFAFARHMSFPEPGPYALSGLILLTFLLSYLSWKLIENPFRNKCKISTKRIWQFSFGGTLICIFFGFSGYYTDGYCNRRWYQAMCVGNYQPDNGILQAESWNVLRKLSNNPTYAVENNKYDRTLWFKKKDNRLKLLLVGNSHSKDLYNALMQSNTANSHFQIERFGTQIFNSKDLFSAPNYINADILLLVSWYSDHDLLALDTVIKKIKSDGKKVAIAKNIIKFNICAGKTNADYLLSKMIQKYQDGDINASMIVDQIDKAYFEEYTMHCNPSFQRKSDNVINVIMNKYPDIIVLDRMDYTCDKPSKRCFSINENFEKYFYDYGHYTLVGASYFGKRIDEVEWLNSLKNSAVDDNME